MEAAGLQHDFRVGNWLIEPRRSRASSGDQAVTLTDDQLQVLLALAVSHGEAVDRSTLRAGLGPGPSGSEDRLRAAIVGLRALFGETARQPHYIANVGNDAYALIAHFETVAPPPAARTATLPAAATEVPRTVTGRAAKLLIELRRRNVLKVTASYLVGMWIVLQVAEVTFAPLRFPDWWMTALTILAITGLPIVAALAWAYEITPAGIVLDAGPDGTGVLPRLPRARQSIAPLIVGGVVLMAAVTGFAWWRSLDVPADQTRTPPPPELGARSIAVLPLVDMSPAGGNAYLGDGLSEELSTRLAQVAGLRVAARTSAFEFRGRNLDVRKIGQSLGVRHVLEGSVRRDGDNLRVTVQLIDTATGYHVWAGNFDRAWRDVLALQDDIALSVTDALEVVLRDRDPSSGPPHHEVNARAIEPYLAGLAALRQPGDASQLDRAQASFQQAIGLDPQFAGAQAGLCRTHTRRFTLTRDPASKVEAERVCREALQLDPTSVETEKALASIAVADGRFATAAKTYAGMLQRNPSDADAYIGLAQALAGLGKGAEAEANYRRAVRAEPAYWGSHAALAKFLFERGRIDEAAAAQRRTTELVPSSASAWSNLGGILQLKGDFDGGLEAFRHSLQLEPSKDAYSNLATAYFYSNRFPEAVANYERAAALGEHDYVIQGNLADALWQTPGRRDDAVARYRRAVLLAENELQATPSAPALRAQLGYFYGRIGDAERSRRYLEEALAAGPDMVYVHYFAGVSAADAGQRETALRAVGELVRMGYPATLLRSAPEFRSLLQDPEYKKIIGTG